MNETTNLPPATYGIEQTLAQLRTALANPPAGVRQIEENVRALMGRAFTEPTIGPELGETVAALGRAGRAGLEGAGRSLAPAIDALRDMAARGRVQ